MTPFDFSELLRLMRRDMRDTVIVIYGPQGCGKTRHAEVLRKMFGKKRVVEEADFPQWREHHTDLKDAVVLTNYNYPPGICMNYINYMDIQNMVEARAAKTKEAQ